MTALERRSPHGFFPDLVDWLESPFTMFRPPATHAIRVEDYTDDGKYVVRAELPGMDPDRDIDITVTDGVLTIQAERQEQHKDGHRSEFRYGAFTRTLVLPTRATTKNIKARYVDGILEVTIPMPETEQESQRVDVETE